MIRVSVLYPHTEGASFDHDYYATRHVGLVRGRLGAALQRVEVDRGLGSAQPNHPAPFVAVGHLYFDTVEAFQQAFATHGQEIAADVANFTSIQPQIQISEVREV